MGEYADDLINQAMDEEWSDRRWGVRRQPRQQTCNCCGKKGLWWGYVDGWRLETIEGNPHVCTLKTRFAKLRVDKSTQPPYTEWTEEDYAFYR